MCRIPGLFLLEAEKKHVRHVHDFNNIETQAVIKFFFFPARQGTEGNSRHSHRNVRGTRTIVCHHRKLGGPV